MSTPIRVAAFLLGLVMVFAGSLAVGRAWGPTLPEPELHDTGGSDTGGPSVSSGVLGTTAFTADVSR